MLLEHDLRAVDLPKQDLIAPQVGEVLQYALRVLLGEQAPVDDVTQDEAPVAREIDVHDLDIGGDPAHIIAPRELAPDPIIAALILDRLDPDALGLGGIV